MVVFLDDENFIEVGLVRERLIGMCIEQDSIIPVWMVVRVILHISDHLALEYFIIFITNVPSNPRHCIFGGMIISLKRIWY